MNRGFEGSFVLRRTREPFGPPHAASTDRDNRARAKVCAKPAKAGQDRCFPRTAWVRISPTSPIGELKKRHPAINTRGTTEASAKIKNTGGPLHAGCVSIVDFPPAVCVRPNRR